ncbi:MAG: hypothetical protein LH614_16700, partial [Pyrinomonadaceae bacterium]|nr:hypothetical protein [Pyrinomonadaceae bacterium]
MNHLNYQDWQMLVSAIGDLHADFDPQTLTERTLAAASQIIAADSVAFTGFRYDGELTDLIWDNSGGFSADEMEIFAAYIHENPLIGAYINERRTETLKITDLIAPKNFERTAIYNEFYRRVGVSN